MEKDIRHLEDDLQANLNKWILAGGGSDKDSSLPLTAVNVGCAVLIMLDSSWGVLGSDGKLKRMLQSADSQPSNSFEIQIPEHVRRAIIQYFYLSGNLFYRRGRYYLVKYH